jgi:predicted 3-demethylubiquinone-9 3-methyltransferase (glyoxalase superfamily)
MTSVSPTAAQRIKPFLWFDDQAEVAARLYTSLFPDSRILDASPGPDGKVMMVSFVLAGLEFTALNGGPQFPFTEAISLSVSCADQAEVDRLWDALTADGGEESQCGWLKDRFGLSWQIVPDALGEVLGGPDREGAARAMEAMLQMRKLDVARLRAAYAGA